jgi:hypothetical protein
MELFAVCGKLCVWCSRNTLLLSKVSRIPLSPYPGPPRPLLSHSRRLEVEYAVQLAKPALEITPAAVNCGGLPVGCRRSVRISVRNVGSVQGKFWVRYSTAGTPPLAEVLVMQKDMRGQPQPIQAQQEGPGNASITLAPGGVKELLVMVDSLPDAPVGAPFTFEMQVRAFCSYRSGLARP